MKSADDNFDALLSYVKIDRLRSSTRSRSRNVLIETESDKGRVINSAAFRRLQQKAQVFPLDSNAAVRTRLTHSVEVSQIGRYIAQKVITGLNASHHNYEKLCAFVNTVETACLLHDIGNPPFGHLGEAAVCEWAIKEELELDLREYDGNPQGFRLISFLAGLDEKGLNLTCTLLLSTIKYPWSIATKVGDKKVGLFNMDVNTYNNACDQVGWIKGKKFPFLLLMEAADDIAYSMSDLEDGLEKGVIRISDISDRFPGRISAPKKGDVVDPMVLFKTKIIRDAVEEAASVFVEKIESILDGGDVSLVDKGRPSGGLIKEVKTFAREKIYSSEEAECIELAGRSAIKGLLRHFMVLLSLEEDSFRRLVDNDLDHIKKHKLHFEQRLFRRLPKLYVDKYKIEARGPEKHRRAHLIVDYISGMTDDYALDRYQLFEGIKIK